MREHFIDTSGFQALMSKRDQYHSEAKAIREKLKQENSTGLTTDLVLSETITILRKHIGVDATYEFYSELLKDSNLAIIFSGSQDIHQAMEVFKRYDDKMFSLTDCLSFAVMEKRGVKHAFTFDHHFEQAGFEMVKTT